MNSIFSSLVLIFNLYFQINWCNSERITYFSTERPTINWFDENVFKNITLRSKRVSRQDPKYYVELYAHTLVTVDNSLTLDFYFYQLLTNRYKPSFVEMHFKFCDMINTDVFFGQTMRNAVGIPCPYPPGVYDLKNLSIPQVPRGFPFPSGRIYCNATRIERGVTTQILYASIDLEIKSRIIKKN